MKAAGQPGVMLSAVFPKSFTKPGTFVQVDVFLWRGKAKFSASPFIAALRSLSEDQVRRGKGSTAFRADL